MNTMDFDQSFQDEDYSDDFVNPEHQPPMASSRRNGAQRSTVTHRRVASNGKVHASHVPQSQALVPRTTRSTRRKLYEQNPEHAETPSELDADEFSHRNGGDGDYIDDRSRERSESSDAIFVRDPRHHGLPSTPRSMGPPPPGPISRRRAGEEHIEGTPDIQPGSSSRRRANVTEETPEPAGEDTSPPVHLSRAHELKLQIKGNLNVFNGGSRKRLPEHDPENYEIKRMRVEENMSWGDIAKVLNEARIKAGKTPSLTEAAVYGRFVRNGPRIAQANGEDFNPSDYMHIKNPKVMTGTPVVAQPRFSQRQDEMLVEAYAEVQALFWDAVADKLDEKCGRRFSADACAKRYQLL